MHQKVCPSVKIRFEVSFIFESMLIEGVDHSLLPFKRFTCFSQHLVEKLLYTKTHTITYTVSSMEQRTGFWFTLIRLNLFTCQQILNMNGVEYQT